MRKSNHLVAHLLGACIESIRADNIWLYFKKTY